MVGTHEGLEGALRVWVSLTLSLSLHKVRSSCLSGLLLADHLHPAYLHPQVMLDHFFALNCKL